MAWGCVLAIVALMFPKGITFLGINFSQRVIYIPSLVFFLAAIAYLVLDIFDARGDLRRIRRSYQNALKESLGRLQAKLEPESASARSNSTATT
jgi:hypothetical protein